MNLDLRRGITARLEEFEGEKGFLEELCDYTINKIKRSDKPYLLHHIRFLAEYEAEKK